MPRRPLLALLLFLCAPLLRAEAEVPLVPNAFSPLKTKLQAGKDAVLFINGDSTSWSEHGPYYLFARALGAETGCTVILYRWAEWVVSKPTGPKEYSPPVTLYQGATGAKLTVYLASLPGAVAGDMFSGARRKNAMEDIPRPDCALLHHGHNMVNFPTAFKGDASSGRGLFLAALAQTSAQWPRVPQAICTQNPWRDEDKYTRIYDIVRTLAADQPQLTLIDSAQRFLAAGKRPDLYRDNVHPSDRNAEQNAGARMVADALLATWHAAQPGAPFITPAWPEPQAPNLISNGDFTDWPAAAPAPTGWTLGTTATAEKLPDTPVFSGKSTVLALHPNGDKSSFLGKTLSEAETAALRGKTITVAALVRSAPDQPRAFASFVCPMQGTNRTFAFGDLGSGKDGWVWLVCSGIPVEATTPRASLHLRLYPAFGLTPPTSNAPLLIQRILILEDKPK